MMLRTFLPVMLLIYEVGMDRKHWLRFLTSMCEKVEWGAISSSDNTILVGAGTKTDHTCSMGPCVLHESTPISKYANWRSLAGGLKLNNSQPKNR